MYSAVIVEPREHKALGFVLQNFLENLSEEWSIILFHGNKNITYVNEIIEKELECYRSRITLVDLKIDNLTIQDYNQLLKSKTFYDSIPTETFLVFQTDTLILKRNKDLIHRFLHYDYVGAPWNHSPRSNQRVGNGGLSLRKKSKMLEIIEKEYDHKNELINEDVFFSCPLTVNIHKPEPQEAKMFSVEEVFHDVTFGCHKVWNRGFDEKFYQLYPEAKTLFELNH